MLNTQEIADKADVIIRGYAVTKVESGYSVINLNKKNSAAVFSVDCEMLETNMDDIELNIARKYLQRAMLYMEDAVA